MDFLERFCAQYFHDPAVALLRASEARLVAQEPLEEPLLDLGSGDGSFLAIVRPHATAVAFDLEPRRARRAGSRPGYATGVAGLAARLPFRSGSFRTVLANSSLEHMAELEAVLREARRVLRPDGRLVLSVHTERFASRMWMWPRLFRALGLKLTPAYRRMRLERLGIVNLLGRAEWRRLLERAGFAVDDLIVYMAPPADEAFERWLVLARFGIWKLHASALLRVAQAACDRLGLSGPRVVLGGLLARHLAGAYRGSEGAGGTAAFVVARAVDTARRGRDAAGEPAAVASHAAGPLR